MAFGWLRRAPGMMWAPIRLLPLVYAVAFIAFIHGPGRTPTFHDWSTALASGILIVAGWRFPLSVSLGQSVLLVLVYRVVHTTLAGPVVFMMALIATGELTMRRRGWPCRIGIVGFVAAQVALYWQGFDLVLTTSSILATMVTPVLLGLYIRSVIQVAVTAQRQREIAVREARSAERTTIARELHDLLAHHLASVALRASVAGYALGDAEPAVAEALADVHATAGEALTDLRCLMATLRDAESMTDQPGAALANPRGLSVALNAAAEKARVAGIRLDAVIAPAVDQLDSMRRLAVLRVVQEGLTNVVKHVGPDARTTLRVNRDNDAVAIHVRDHGPADTHALGRTTRHPKGFGLIGLRERVEVLGGTMTAEPHPPGWELAVTIPDNVSEDAR